MLLEVLNQRLVVGLEPARGEGAVAEAVLWGVAQAAGGLGQGQAARPGALEKHGGVPALQAGEGGDGLGVIPAPGPGGPRVEHDAAAQGDHRALSAQDEAVAGQGDDGLGEAKLGEALLTTLDGRAIGLSLIHI